MKDFGVDHLICLLVETDFKKFRESSDNKGQLSKITSTKLLSYKEDLNQPSKVLSNPKSRNQYRAHWD